MRVAMLTPLPPSKSGVAHYASMLIPELGRAVELRAFATLDGYSADDHDAVVYQLGNNPHHEVMYREAMQRPGVIVLHDLVLHHLIVELTLARGDAEGYVAALRANHGAAGAAWARGRAAGLHTEMGNFLLPASVEVARRSRAVIVHNRYAADRLRSFGVTTPVHVVPHPAVAEDFSAERAAMRARHGIGEEQRVIGFFGFVTSAKRGEVVLEAFREARRRDPRLVLLIVGEAAPNIDAKALEGDGVIVTGYVPDEEFGAYYAAADRLVNLRYPSAGETSGTLMRAFSAGKPVAVSDYAQFAEFPESCVRRIAFGDREVETLAAFFLEDLDERKIAGAQREWLDANARMEQTVAAYVRAIDSAAAAAAPAVRATATSMPLFPRLDLIRATAHDGHCTIVVRNAGESTLRGRSYDEPAYRVIAKIVVDGRVVQDRWLALPGDLASGAEVAIEFPLVAVTSPFTLELHHAMQQVPMLEPQPWARAEVRSV